MLEKDPSILDRARSVKVLIVKCATDASSMVRDSALTLIGKCIVLRPALEGDFLGHVLRLTDDPAAGVRKRSMKLLKDMYLRNTDRNAKIAIGDSLYNARKTLTPESRISLVKCLKISGYRRSGHFLNLWMHLLRTKLSSENKPASL